MRLLETWLKEHPELLPILVKRWGLKPEKRKADDPAAIAALMLDPARADSVYGSLDTKQRDALRMLHGSGNKLAEPMFFAINKEIRKMGAGQIESQKPHEKPLGPAEALYYGGFVALGTDQLSNKSLGPIVYIPDDLANILPFHKTGYENLEPIDETEFDEEDDEGDESEEIVTPAAPVASPPKSAPVAPAPRTVTPKKEAPAPQAKTAPPPARKAPAPEPEPAAASDRPRRLASVTNARPADTSLVDDLTTLLAFFQVVSANLSDTLQLDEPTRRVITAHLIVKDAARIDFMLQLGITAGLIELQGGKAYTKRAESRRWLEAPRGAQIQLLAETWRDSDLYVDLVHVPGLTVEEDGWSYDPVDARKALLELIHDLVPQDGAWSVDELIEEIYQTAPDFQRIGGDFDSWYIKGGDGEYLSGFESWPAVEGALVEFVLYQPMYWLGLLTKGDDSVQFNAYGRAFIGGQPFPQRPDPTDQPTLDSDGTVRIGRSTSRFDRFQVARFTSWVSPATATEPYVYRIDAKGIERGAEQGINTDQIATYIQRLIGDAPLPQFVATLLQQWRGGAQAGVSLEHQLILQTKSQEVLDAIYNNPDLRRYMGRRLGTTDVIVRADQWEQLVSALENSGVSVNVRLNDDTGRN